MDDAESIYFKGYCPNTFCNELLTFHENDEFIICSYCGNRITPTRLLDIKSIATVERNEVISMLSKFPKRQNEFVRVNGLAAYHCKFISYYITNYGVDDDGNVYSLNTFNKDGFDCKQLADYAFYIDENHLSIDGYGLDSTCSEYLSSVLSKIEAMNDDKEALYPISVAGYGNNLLNSISRCLVGREAFWHPFHRGLQKHFADNEDWYGDNLSDFIDEEDWEEFGKEFDAEYTISSDDNYDFYLIYIFALANILYRPIILLDIPVNEDSSRIFLPLLRPVEECRNRNGHLHKPVIIAWADESHTSFIPLVAGRSRPIVRFHRNFLPEVWYFKDRYLEEYIEFEEDECIVAGGKYFPPLKLNRTINVMNFAYLNHNDVHPMLICDYCEDILEHDVFVSKVNFSDIANEIYKLCKEQKLWRCIICWHLSRIGYLDTSLYVGGDVYEKLVHRYQGETFKDGNTYIYEPIGSFFYNETSKSFVPKRLQPSTCHQCGIQKNQLRLQYSDNEIRFLPGDHTRNPAPNSYCKRKMKHFYNGDLYDNMHIEYFEVDYKGEKVKEMFEWIEKDSTEERLTKIEGLISEIIARRFPNEQCNMKLWNDINQCIWTKVNMFSSLTPRLCFDPFVASVDHKKNSVFDDKQSEIHKEKRRYLSVACSNGKNVLIEWKENLSYTELVNRICELMRIKVSKIDKIYYGDPSTLLTEDEFPLPLTEFMKVFVEMKKSAATVTNQRSIVCTNTTIVLIKFLHFLCEKSIGTSKIWQRLMKCPKMFLNSGVLYRLIIGKHGKQEGHYSLPALFPKQTFVYSSCNDRLELCIPNVGHFEINENLRNKVLEKLKSLNCENRLEEIFDQLAPKYGTPVTDVVQVISCT